LTLSDIEPHHIDEWLEQSGFTLMEDEEDVLYTDGIEIMTEDDIAREVIKECKYIEETYKDLYYWSRM